jgi:hypothetical protein
MRPLFRAAAMAGLSVIVASSAASAASKPAKNEPPACAALSFRTVASGLPDGDHEAGQYRSRFGRIEIVAKVEGGLAKNYAMVLNGKPVDPNAPAPAAANACLESKHVKVPFKKQAAGACAGERFRVVIDRSGKTPVALFFGLQGNEWAYCSGATL